MKTFTDKLNESVSFPERDGWYWVLLDGYEDPTPCWFSIDEDGGYFLPGGMGDSSSTGLFADDITKVGPEIIVPQF